MQLYEGRAALEPVNPSEIASMERPNSPGKYTFLLYQRRVCLTCNDILAGAHLFRQRFQFTFYAAGAPSDLAGGKRILTLIGEGTAGVVTFQPESLELGEVQVGYHHSRPITLINNSDGCIRYALALVAESPANQIDEAHHEDLPVDFSSGPGALKTSKQANIAASRQMFEAWVDNPEGTLDARSSKTVCRPVNLCAIMWLHCTYVVPHRQLSLLAALSLQVVITLHPQHRRSYRLKLLCCSPGTSIEPVVLCNGAPAGIPSLAAADVRANAAFPAVAVTDVHCEGIAKPVAWQMMKLTDINSILSSAITASEIQVRLGHCLP